MKTGIFVCFLVIFACLFLKADSAENCNDVKGDLSLHYGICARIKCNPDGGHSAVGCAESRCEPGKQIGYKEADNSKPYPECCANPICAK